jgi:hypothetical protein
MAFSRVDVGAIVFVLLVSLISLAAGFALGFWLGS